jgi:hypothetical protein
MIKCRGNAPMRRWRDAVRPVNSDVRILHDHRKVLRFAQDDSMTRPMRLPPTLDTTRV